jgi:hypothetical protein
VPPGPPGGPTNTPIPPVPPGGPPPAPGTTVISPPGATPTPRVIPPPTTIPKSGTADPGPLLLLLLVGSLLGAGLLLRRLTAERSRR